MNERIKELALRANPASKEIYESDSWQFNCAAWSAEDLAKFAELIVREVLLYQETLISSGHNAWHIHTPTKEYFGVEE